MEEAKAAAYYDELTRKGEGAARFKRGLGFASESLTSKPYLSSSSSSSTKTSFYSSFVPASDPEKAVEIQKQVQLENIQKKLSKGGSSDLSSRHYGDDDHRRRCSRDSRCREENERGLEGSSSRVADRSERDRGRDGESRRRFSPGRRSRSPSVSDRRRREKVNVGKDLVDYSVLIDGYFKLTPAERVKAKMKLQLSQTAAEDKARGMNNVGWERFDFNKDAPLDEDDELEVADDDASLVKNISRSFRFAAVEAKHEEDLKASHDRAMFGASPFLQETVAEAQEEKVTEPAETTGINKEACNDLMSEKIFALQSGNWRDRARRH